MAFALLLLLIWCVLIFLAVWFFAKSLRWLRMIADTPVSKTRGVFIGQVEINGVVRLSGLPALESPLAEAQCVAFSSEIKERVTTTSTDSKGKTTTSTSWESVWSDNGDTPFFVEDETGSILVRPARAKLSMEKIFDEECRRSNPLYFGKGPSSERSHSDGIRRFTEYALLIDKPTFVAGPAREREDAVAAEIAAPKDGKPDLFLISSFTEERELSWLKWKAAGYAFGGGVLVVVPWLFIFSRNEILPTACLSAFAVWCGVLLITWLIGLYNSYVRLRNRVGQAWSLVDVQLKRRADLIPNLCKVVETSASHEHEVLETVASLRAQIGATPKGKPGEDIAGVGNTIIALAEKYPDLKVSTAFQELHKNLVDCEDRIALARAYFNDIVMFYNTRLEVFPDGILAHWVGFHSRDAFEADGLERAPVQVSLASVAGRPSA